MNIKVTSKVMIDADKKQVWECLCNAKMQLSAPWWFKFGIPTPQQCLVIHKNEEIVTDRQCQTSQGVINQKITKWQPYDKLSFVPVSNNIGLSRYLKNMEDTFVLKSVDGKTLLTRLTRIEIDGMGAFLKGIVLKLILKQIHVFVMKNFKKIIEDKLKTVC